MDEPSSSASTGDTPTQSLNSGSSHSQSSFKLRPSSLTAQVNHGNEADAHRPGNGNSPHSSEVSGNHLNVPVSSSSVAQNTGRSILRPSVLKVASAEPSVLSSTTDSKNTVSSSPAKNNNSSVTTSRGVIQRVSSEANGVSSSSSSVSVISTAPRVVESIQTPVIKVNGSTAQSVTREQETGSDTGGGFVFGQNLSDRVILPATPPDSTDVEDFNSSSNQHNKPEKKENLDDLGSKGPAVLGLAACSSSTSPSGSNKRKYEAITGEEDESNVLQIHCKLYQWEKEDSSWKEKGKGFLKLNDKKKDDKLCSRLVMRTSGSLKVVLNCSLVTGMNFSKSSETSIKFTDFAGLYSVKGKEKDIELLYNAVDYRLRELSKRLKSDESSSSLKQSLNQQSHQHERYHDEDDDEEDVYEGDDTNDSTAPIERLEDDGGDDSNPHIVSSVAASRGSTLDAAVTGVTSSCSSSPGSTSHSHPSSSMRRDDSGRDADAEDEDEEEDHRPAVDQHLSSQDKFDTLRDQREDDESNTNEASLSNDS